jgi:hypothetical protein
MYNQHPYEPHDLAMQKIRGSTEEHRDVVDTDYDPVATDFLESFANKLSLAKRNLDEAAERMESKSQQLRASVDLGLFEVGRKVYLDATNLRVTDNKGRVGAQRALDCRRLGPYEIVETLGDYSAFRLKLPPHQRFHPVQPISRLEPERSSEEFPDAHESTPPQPVVTDDGEEEFEVEKITRHRMNRGRREYLVQFLGYEDEADRMWLPESNLQNSSDLLKQYKKDRNLIPTRRSERRQ